MRLPKLKKYQRVWRRSANNNYVVAVNSRGIPHAPYGARTLCPMAYLPIGTLR
jgi:hypothetical protein